MTESLPTAIEQLDRDWLTSALGIGVADVATADVLWGTATKVRVQVTYEDGVRAGGPPADLCIKGSFDDKLQQHRDQLPKGAPVSAFVVEANFFSQMAPTFEARLPRCWYAASDAHSGQGIVILDDLAARGCEFGDPSRPWLADLVADALIQQASWHAQTWGSSRVHAWLNVGSAPVRLAAGIFFSSAYWDALFTTDCAPVLPPALRDPSRLHTAFKALWQLDDAGTLCVAHGDAHVGNTYIDVAGAPAFLDWQGACLGPWSYDVAYFLSGAMAVEDRRIYERQLLRTYLDALAAAGGPSIPEEDAWLEYRRHLLHGILWAPTPPDMQPPDRVRIMTERHASAIEDHDVLTLLNAG